MFKIFCDTTFILILEPEDYIKSGRQHQQPIYAVGLNRDAYRAWSIYGIKTYKPFKFEIIKHREKSNNSNLDYDTFLINISVDYLRIKSRYEIVVVPLQTAIYQVLSFLCKHWKYQTHLITPIFQIYENDFLKYVNKEITEIDYYFPT